jgi:hypothetical protein
VYKKTKVILVASIVIIAASLLAYTSLQQVSAKKSSGDYMDFSADVPFQIHATPGGIMTIPVTIYGSTTARSVDVVITQADPKFGLTNVDTTHTQLPSGFTVTLPLNHIEMQAMSEVAHQKPLMTTNMTISVAYTVKPGVYGFAIHMMSKSPDGFPDDHASAFYVSVQ